MDNELIDALIQRLLAVQAAFDVNMADRAREFGLSVTQVGVAQDLRQNPGSTLQDVCSRLGWPKSTVSRVVDDLVNRGLVLREIPASNRRTVILSLQGSAQDCVPPPIQGIFPGGIPEQASEIESIVKALDRVLVMLKRPS